MNAEATADLIRLPHVATDPLGRAPLLLLVVELAVSAVSRVDESLSSSGLGCCLVAHSWRFAMAVQA